jgi:hypothetical protein
MFDATMSKAKQLSSHSPKIRLHHWEFVREVEGRLCEKLGEVGIMLKIP